MRRLAVAGCVAPDDEAEELLGATALRDDAAFETALRRRENGEPLAWIVGSTRFCGHDVRVDVGVYVPRPQTEALAERAAALLASGGRHAVAVDLCTGAGAVALHCVRSAPGAAVVGVDANLRAVLCARRNGVRAVVGDLGSPLRDGCADVVTAVAPYVPTAAMAYLPSDVQRYEPQSALDGGVDGLAVVRRVVTDAGRILRPTGWLLVELGDGQDMLLRPTLEDQWFDEITPWEDDEGDLRGLAARRCRRPTESAAVSRARADPLT